MYVTQEEKMEAEEKGIVMIGQDQEIAIEEGKGQGPDLEIKVNVNEVEGPGQEKENEEDPDPETKRKAEEVLDLDREIDVTGGTEIEKAEKVELKRAILISKKSPSGKMKSTSKKNLWTVWLTMAMVVDMEIMMIKVLGKSKRNVVMMKENHKSLIMVITIMVVMISHKFVCI